MHAAAAAGSSPAGRPGTNAEISSKPNIHLPGDLPSTTECRTAFDLFGVSQGSQYVQ